MVWLRRRRCCQCSQGMGGPCQWGNWGCSLQHWDLIVGQSKGMHEWGWYRHVLTIHVSTAVYGPLLAVVTGWRICFRDLAHVEIEELCVCEHVEIRREVIPGLVLVLMAMVGGVLH